MKSLLPNNKNPKSLSYAEIDKRLTEVVAEEGEWTAIGVGNNTFAFYSGALGQEIKIKFHDTVVAILHDEDTVSLWTGGHKTETTRRRLDWVLLPLGYRMGTKHGTGKGRVRWGENHDEFKVYRIKDGMYLEFHEGMTLPRSR